MRVPFILLAPIVASFASGAAAQQVRITDDMPFFTYSLEGREYLIERNQDISARVEDPYARTSRPCPPHCVQPMQAAPGVATLGELEVLDFLKTHAARGTGLLADTRGEEEFARGTIPGALNLPAALLAAPENPFFAPLLQSLGATRIGRGWEFSNARSLLLFCGGPWCGDAPGAIRSLIAAGYPPGKLFYYRGGMQSWASMGFRTLASAP